MLYPSMCVNLCYYAIIILYASIWSNDCFQSIQVSGIARQHCLKSDSQVQQYCRCIFVYGMNYMLIVWKKKYKASISFCLTI